MTGMGAVSHPIEGQVILLAGAKASVTLTRLSELLDLVQRYLGDRIDTYDRRFERIDGPNGTIYYLAGPEHWESVGRKLDLSEREIDAVRRTHEAQFERHGRRLDRKAEFETSLEIRDVLAVTSPET